MTEIFSEILHTVHRVFMKMTIMFTKRVKQYITTLLTTQSMQCIRNRTVQNNLRTSIINIIVIITTFLTTTPSPNTLTNKNVDKTTKNKVTPTLRLLNFKITHSKQHLHLLKQILLRLSEQTNHLKYILLINHPLSCQHKQFPSFHLLLLLLLFFFFIFHLLRFPLTVSSLFLHRIPPTTTVLLFPQPKYKLLRFENSADEQRRLIHTCIFIHINKFNNKREFNLINLLKLT